MPEASGQRVISIDTLRRHAPERGLRIEVDADDYDEGQVTLVGEYAGIREAVLLVQTARNVLAPVDLDSIYEVRFRTGLGAPDA